MNVFFDEDNGTGIPKALRLVRVPATQIAYPSNDPGSPLAKGATDIEWLRWVGRHGFLAISQNQRLVANPVELQELSAASAGVVFIGSGREQSWKVLRLLLRRWEWLQQVDLNEHRPFAFRLHLNNTFDRFDFSSSIWV